MKTKHNTLFQIIVVVSMLVLPAVIIVISANHVVGGQSANIALVSGQASSDAEDQPHPLNAYFRSDQFKADVQAYRDRVGADHWTDAQIRAHWEQSSAQMREEARWASLLDSLLYANPRLHGKKIPKQWQSMSDDITALNVLAATLILPDMKKSVKAEGSTYPMEAQHAQQAVILPRMKQLRLQVTYEVMTRIYGYKPGSPFLRPWEQDPDFHKQAP